MNEASIQKTIFQHLKARAAPGAFYWHNFSGGYRRPVEAAIYKGMGAVAGLPDVMVLHRGFLYAIELKTAKGRPTEAQLACLDAIRAAGGFAVVCNGLDRALAALEMWKLLKGKTA